MVRNLEVKMKVTSVAKLTRGMEMRDRVLALACDRIPDDEIAAVFASEHHRSLSCGDKVLPITARRIRHGAGIRIGKSPTRWSHGTTLLSTPELAARLKIPVNRLYVQIRQGRLVIDRQPTGAYLFQYTSAVLSAVRSRRYRPGQGRHRPPHRKFRRHSHPALAAKHPGQARYPAARSLLITADCGGSNGAPVPLWKRELQALADEFGLTVTVCHLPHGTSRWNRIEHRLLSFITQNWRGKPLRSYQPIVQLIAATTTPTGLSVKSEIDNATYSVAVKVRDSDMGNINITPHEFHGESNYTIRPNAE